MKLEDLLLNEDVRKFIEENIPDENQRTTLIQEHINLARRFQALLVEPLVTVNNNNGHSDTRASENSRSEPVNNEETVQNSRGNNNNRRGRSENE